MPVAGMEAGVTDGSVPTALFLPALDKRIVTPHESQAEWDKEGYQRQRALLQ